MKKMPITNTNHLITNYLMTNHLIAYHLIANYLITNHLITNYQYQLPDADIVQLVEEPVDLNRQIIFLWSCHQRESRNESCILI